MSPGPFVEGGVADDGVGEFGGEVVVEQGVGGGDPGVDGVQPQSGLGDRGPGRVDVLAEAAGRGGGHQECAQSAGGVEYRAPAGVGEGDHQGRQVGGGEGEPAGVGFGVAGADELERGGGSALFGESDEQSGGVGVVEFGSVDLRPGGQGEQEPAGRGDPVAEGQVVSQAEALPDPVGQRHLVGFAVAAEPVLDLPQGEQGAGGGAGDRLGEVLVSAPPVADRGPADVNETSDLRRVHGGVLAHFPHPSSHYVHRPQPTRL